MLKLGKCAAENRHTAKSWMGDLFTVETAVMLHSHVESQLSDLKRLAAIIA